MRERTWIPPLHLLSREQQTKTFVTKDSSKLFSNLFLKKMTPNALIMVMPRGSVRPGLYFAKCYIKYQMVPILKSLLSQKPRQTKGWLKRVELHLSADKAGYSKHHGAIRRLVINSWFHCHLLQPPTSHSYGLGKPRGLSVPLFPLRETRAAHLTEEFWGWNSCLSEGSRTGHVQSSPSADHISSHKRLLPFRSIHVHVR